jgi:hypothetical protein
LGEIDEASEKIRFGVEKKESINFDKIKAYKLKEYNGQNHNNMQATKTQTISRIGR